VSFPSAVVFLWWASLRNRVRKQLERLRQPKYLVGLVVGGAYLYAVLLRRLSFRGPSEVLSPDVRMVAELPLAGILMASLAAAWALGQDRPSLSFTETEVQQLFSAPVSRRALLHYKLGRGMFGAAVAAFFTTLFIGRTVSLHPVLFFVLSRSGAARPAGSAQTPTGTAGGTVAGGDACATKFTFALGCFLP
jgi:hypothetical protein